MKSKESKELLDTENPSVHIRDANKKQPCNICKELTPFSLKSIYYCQSHSPTGYISVEFPERVKK